MSAMQGKVVAVTGGSGGIGAAICRQFAEAGAQVQFSWRSDEMAARALLAELPGTGHGLRRLAVEDTPALADWAAGVARDRGRCDVLVNCAGITRFVPHADLDALDDALIDEIFRTNWRGAFAAVRAFRPLLAASGDGLVVNISSVAGVTGMGSNVAYCASKAALDAMTKSFARALAPPDPRAVGVAGSGRHPLREGRRPALARRTGGTHAAAPVGATRRGGRCSAERGHRPALLQRLHHSGRWRAAAHVVSAPFESPTARPDP